VQLYTKLHVNDGLEILAFPCNSFGGQEPGSNEEVLQFTMKYGVTFPVLGKLDCGNTASSHPLFQFLREKAPSGILGKMMLWNFSKFLCDANGVPLKRYAPTANPLSIESDIQAVIDGHIPVEDVPTEASTDVQDESTPSCTATSCGKKEN